MESHPVDVIKRANRARSKLDRRYKIRVSPLKIVDERNPKRPRSPFALYVRAHAHEVSGEGGAVPIIKLLSEQWKGLGDTEKKPYQDLAAAERTKYNQEYGQPQA